MLRTSFQQLFAVVFLAVFFGFGIAVDSVSNKRRDTELFLRRMSQTKLGTSSFADVRALAEEYGGKPESDGSKKEDCSAQACTFTFVIENRPLNYLPGVQPVRLVATLAVRNGYASEQQISYTTRDFEYLLTDHIEDHGFEVQRLKLDVNGMPHVLKVNLGPSASKDERRRAYSIELSCLSRLRGCRNAAAIFPPGL